MTFAEDLADWMNRASLSNAQLAKRLGVKDPTVSRWLDGSIPKPATLPALAKALGVSEKALRASVGPRAGRRQSVTGRQIADLQERVTGLESALQELRDELGRGR